MIIQVEVYQADFNAERQARERIAGEKADIEEELRKLKGRTAAAAPPTAPAAYQPMGGGGGGSYQPMGGGGGVGAGGPYQPIGGGGGVGGTLRERMNNFTERPPDRPPPPRAAYRSAFNLTYLLLGR
jgi:hypothetical protein